MSHLSNWSVGNNDFFVHFLVLTLQRDLLLLMLSSHHFTRIDFERVFLIFSDFDSFHFDLCLLLDHQRIGVIADGGGLVGGHDEHVTGVILGNIALIGIVLLAHGCLSLFLFDDFVQFTKFQGTKLLLVQVRSVFSSQDLSKALVLPLQNVRHTVFVFWIIAVGRAPLAERHHCRLRLDVFDVIDGVRQDFRLGPFSYARVALCVVWQQGGESVQQRVEP